MPISSPPGIWRRSLARNGCLASVLFAGRPHRNAPYRSTMSEPLTAGEKLVPTPSDGRKGARRQPPQTRRPRRGLFRRFVRGVAGGVFAIVLLAAVIGGA